MSEPLIEIYQLRTFIAVAAAKHLTRAAERLHLSQPAVSAHVKALEDALGVRLFARNPNGMELTRAGRDLLEHAQRVLAEVDELRRAARTFTGHIGGQLRIGTLSDPEFIRLGDFLGRVVARHPLLELELRAEVSGAALEAVRDGQLDASFYYGAIDIAPLERLALTEVVYRVAAPAAWKGRVEGADWNAITALPWILTPQISTHNRLLRTLFIEHGVTPTKVIEADNEAVIGNLIESGVGLSLLREDHALEKQAAGEVCIWGEIRLPTTLWFIYRRGRESEPALAALLAVLRETWQLPPVAQGGGDGSPGRRTRRAAAKGAPKLLH